MSPRCHMHHGSACGPAISSKAFAGRPQRVARAPAMGSCQAAPFSCVPVFFRMRPPALPKAASWAMTTGRLDETRRPRRRAARAVFVRARGFSRARPAAPPKASTWGMAMGRPYETRRRRRRAPRAVFVRAHRFFARTAGGASHGLVAMAMGRLEPTGRNPGGVGVWFLLCFRF